MKAKRILSVLLAAMLTAGAMAGCSSNQSGGESSASQGGDSSVQESVAATEKTDVDVNVGKQELAVKVNGKDFEIKKADDEKYVFDKYKLQLNQTSRADLNITVPVIDKTKHWEIGIGTSKDGAVGMIGFPVKGNIGGWIAGRQDNVMAGVVVKI